MNPTPQYSSLFSCLYNEPEPVGHLGRGTHYSVLRSVEWLDVERLPLATPQIHDFAVIWDEDHDTRIIDVIEKIYMAGLLSPIQFIGERKGFLSIVLAAKFGIGRIGPEVEAYKQAISPLSVGEGDSWNLEFGTFDRHDTTHDGHQTELPGIIADDYQAAFNYLKHIDYLWKLGTKVWHPRAVPGAPPPPLPGLPFGLSSEALANIPR